MKKSIVFGAGHGGKNFFTNSKNILNKERVILAFIDNDKTKQNTTLFDLPIISPEQISDIEYDEIVIASLWAKPIVEQLVKTYEIPLNKIFIPSKNFLMEIAYPFKNVKTRTFAKEIIKLFSNEAIQQKIPLYVNNGTLLGIIRDNDILKWDTDIDFAIHDEEANKFDMDNFIINTVKKLDLQSISVIKYINKDNRTLSYLVDFKLSGITSFPISIEYIYIDGDYAKEAISFGQFKVPKKYILNLTQHKFNESIINIPTNVEKYLSFIYGNWKIPKQNISFYDYTNYDSIENERLIQEGIKEFLLYEK